MNDNPEIRFLGDLQRLELKPGDKFVLTVGQHINGETHKIIQEVWQQFVGDESLKLLILEKDMKLGVINGGEK